MIIQELNTAYTPYFNHAHIQLVNLKIQFGSSQQALQKSLHTKIEKKLLEQIHEIQTDILQDKYHIPSIDVFKTLAATHDLQNLESLLAQNIRRLFPHLAEQGQLPAAAGNRAQESRLLQQPDFKL